MKRWEQLKYEVEFEYGRLADGETSEAEVCPSCKGGSSEEKSFRVSRGSGVLLYFCHRSSCTFRGRIGISYEGGGQGSGSGSTAKRVRVPTEAADPAALRILAERYGISEQTLESLGLRWCGKSSGYYAGRFCFPIIRPDSKESGANFRTLAQGVSPKSIIQLYDPESVSSSWVKLQRRSDYLVIVEDQISAYKIGAYYHSLALLGTNLNEAKVNEILEQKPEYEKVFLCLDNDATFHAIKLQLMWKSKIKGLNVIGLNNKDIKDMDEKEFEKFFERLV